MTPKTLIIGSTGVLGRSITRVLDAADWGVVGMRRWDSEVAYLDEIGVRDVVGDVRDRDRLVEAMSGVNYVVYCSAPDTDLEPDAYRRRATTGIRNVLQVSREEDVERVVVTSSAVTVGRPDEDREADESDYYLPGTAGDHFVEAAYAVEQECYRQAADGQYVVMLNPTVVIGPGASLPARSQLRGVSGDDPVNWVDLGRVARAHLEALEWGHRGERYIVAGHDGTIGELYDLAADEPDVDVRRRGVGRPQDRNRYLLTDGQHIDGSKAEREFELS